MTAVAISVGFVLLLTVLNGLFSMSETALISARKARLRQRSGEGDGGARAALELAGSPNRFLSTVQIGISLIGVLAGAFGGARLAEPLAGALRVVPVLAPYAGPLAFALVVAAITYLSLIVGELVPKRLALNNPEAVAARIAPPMRLLSTLTAPVVWFLGASTEAVLRLLGARTPEELPITEREFEVLLEEGARAGVFEDEERDLARRALRLDDRPVRELMTPRPLISWLDAEDPTEEHRRVAAESRHSYYPVARGDLGDLLGVASAKDAWVRVLAGEDADLLGELRGAPLVPEGAPATAALESFKRSGLPLALVIDERGDIEGLITLNDVLEALVGDLPDADAPEEDPITRREDGSWLVDGLLAADELKARLGLDELPRETTSDYQTVGGMVMDNLGRVPAAGDQFDWAGFRFEVIDMDGRRVDKLLVAPARDTDTGNASG